MSGWVTCIHGRTISMRQAVYDGARPECSDCEELDALKKVVQACKEQWVNDKTGRGGGLSKKIWESVAKFDAIVARREKESCAG